MKLYTSKMTNEILKNKLMPNLESILFDNSYQNNYNQSQILAQNKNNKKIKQFKSETINDKNGTPSLILNNESLILNNESLIEIKGYIYFIYSPELYKKGFKYIKIGRTKNLEKRIKQLQTGNPFDLTFYKTIFIDNYKEIEVNLHKKYKHKNKRGEWFDIQFSDVDKEIDLLFPKQEETLFSKIIKKVKSFFTFNF